MSYKQMCIYFLIYNEMYRVLCFIIKNASVAPNYQAGQKHNGFYVVVPSTVIWQVAEYMLPTKQA